MDICRVIQDLLIKNGSVSVPALGTFTLKYVPAQLYKFTNRVAPPSYELDFSTKINEQDNSLVTVLSQEYDMDEPATIEKLQVWVNEINEKINSGESFFLKDIGTLQKEDDRVKFKADKNSSLLADNFGLESTNLPLFELEENNVAQKVPAQNQPAKSTQSSSKVAKYFVTTAIIVFIGTGLFLVYDMGFIDEPINFFATLFQASKEEKKQLATNDTLSGKIDANELKRNALLYKESSDSAKPDSSVKKVIKYYLIAGSFKALKNAENQRDVMIKKGFSPEILNLGDTVYRVSLASFIERSKAVEEYITVIHQDNTIQVWLYSQLINK